MQQIFIPFLRFAFPVAIFILLPGNGLNAQTNCTDPPCANADQGNGPDPCESKLYCSNSDAVDDGFIACTPSADTDGCGVDASASTVPVGDTEQLLLDIGDPNCFQSGWNVQWIRFLTDDFVNEVKIQGVGGPLDAWAVFWAPNFVFDPLDPQATDLQYCDDPLTDLQLIGGCVTVNQFTTVTNLNSTAEINLYYIALIYSDTGNGTINFKSKECKTVSTCDPAIECPPPATFDCSDQAGLADWLSQVSVTDCGNLYTAVNDYDPNDFLSCDATVTINFWLADTNGDPVLDGNGNTIQCSVDLTIVPDPPDPFCPTPSFLLPLSANGDDASICGEETATISVTVTGGIPSIGTGHAINMVDGSFHVFNLTDPFNHANSIGPGTTPSVQYAADFVAGTYYLLDAGTDQLHSLNTSTGQLSASIGTATPVVGETWTGLAWDASSGTTYALSADLAGNTNSTLYLLDLTNGNATPIGATGFPAGSWLAIDHAGNAYAADQANDRLYSIDLSTAMSTLIGSTGVDMEFCQGADFDPNTGLLYTAVYTTNDNGNTFQPQLALVDLTTGQYHILITGPNNNSFNHCAFALLNSNTDGYSYQWNTGETTPSITVNSAGTYTVTVTDFCGNTAVETLFVTDEQGNTTLVCNGDINVSLDENGIAILTPEMVLEGEDGCLDGYIVEIGDTGSNVADCSMIGQTFSVMVTAPDGNSCWNDGWAFEDKLDPHIKCGDLILSCTESNDPDDIDGPVLGTYTIVSTDVVPIPDNDPAGVAIPITVPEDCTLPLEDVNLSLTIQHTQVDHLAANLESPSGTSVMLFVRPGIPGSGCSHDHIDVVFDGEADNTAADFEATCNGGSGAAISGSFQAFQSMSAFDGEDPSGVWTLTVFDLAAAETGTLINAQLTLAALYDDGGVTTTDNCDDDLTLTYTQVDNTGCTPEGFGSITRTWTATDDSGNSATCVQTITLTRPTLDDIDCPLDWTGLPGQNDMLICNSGFPTDINGHPDPSHTGQPTYNGAPINGLCMFNIVYTDVVIPDISCEGNVTYQRTWTILDMCFVLIKECTQLIKVIDNTGPLITCPDDLVEPANSQCKGNVILPPPTIVDACSNANNSYVAETSGGTLTQNASGVYVLYDLDVGTIYTVTYTASDGCGNTSSCSFGVEVTDQTMPVPACETYHTVVLNGTSTYVNAIVFDDNSHDNCGIVSYEVRRLTDCSGNNDTDFGPTVDFHCCDLGSVVTVELRITDAVGLSNTCTVYAEVQDNVVPTISCPSPGSKDLHCTDLSSLDDYDGVTATDTGIPAIYIEVDGTETPVGYYDADLVDFICSATVYISDQGFANNCGVGTVTRTYTVTNGSGLSSSCVFIINITDPDPFDPNVDIDWPDDLLDPGVLCSQSILPDDLPTGHQRPVYTPTPGCDHLSLPAYTDSPPFYPNNPTEEYCYKILRTWTMLDWCSGQTVSDEQIIKIVDPGPDFSGCPSGPVDLNFGDLLNLNISATDHCSGNNSTITYVVDLDDDGVIDLNNGTGGVINTNVGGADFPVGTHRIIFTAAGSASCYVSGTCEVLVNIQSVPPGVASVSGAIFNEASTLLENATVSPANGMDVVLTDDSGQFGFNLPTYNNYNITPQKDDDHLNGVSTYDLVLISKHILETELFDSPYKFIAGDVNKSGNITTIDIVELRKVILFINDEFPNNTSWRFVDAAYVFPDPVNPFAEAFPETYPINNLLGQMNDVDFIAVKVGDVNGSAQTNALGAGADDRNFDGTLQLEVEDIDLEAGQSHTIEVRARDFKRVLGCQFTLNVDQLEVIDVLPGVLPGLSANNFGWQYRQDGVLTASWNVNNAVTFDDEEVLFSLVVQARSMLTLSEVVRISSHLTKAEAYAEKENLVELLDLELLFRDESGSQPSGKFELYQNRPNPFVDETVIGFELPQNGRAILTLSDLSGKVFKTLEGFFLKGYNEVSFDRSDLPGGGVLYYKLSTDTHSAIRMMTIID